MKLALAQFASEKTRSASIDKAFTMMEQAAERGADVICFPEMAFDPFFPQERAKSDYFKLAEPVPGPTTKLFQDKAKQFGLVTVLNLFEEASPGEHYDCSPVIDKDGAYLGKARMMHIAEEPHFNEKFYYWLGNTGYPVFDTQAGRIGIANRAKIHLPVAPAQQRPQGERAESSA